MAVGDQVAHRFLRATEVVGHPDRAVADGQIARPLADPDRETDRLRRAGIDLRHG